MLKHHDHVVQNWFLLCSLYDKIQDANVVVVVEGVICELLRGLEGWFTNVSCYLALNTCKCQFV